MKDNISQAEGRPILTDVFVKELMKIPKRMLKGTLKSKITDQNIRTSADLVCDDKCYKFVISTRQSIIEPDNFSVVFIYIDTYNRNYIIRRYNGDHGRHFHKYSNTYVSGPHIHMITEKTQDRCHKDETKAEETKEYITFREAMIYARNDLNIQGWIESMNEGEIQ